MVDGASDIAAHINVSKSFIGLTLVAFGTSSPEFFVNVIAALNDHTELALSNIAGSNITNLCIGFGISALLVTIPISRREFRIDLFFMALTPGLVVISFLAFSHQLSRWMLIPFIGLLIAYLATLARRSESDAAEDPTHLTIHKPLIYFLLGVVALYIGGELVYRNAVSLAKKINAPESLIGLTVVACGTSIPDVTASVIAARKKEFGICTGNLLGSNILNIFVVLGGTLVAAGSSLQGNGQLLIDYSVITLLGTGFATYAVLRQKISRLGGVLMIGAFLGYLGWRISVTIAAAAIATS